MNGDNVSLLKIGSNHNGPIGPGNFQLFELGGSGANIVRQNLAGAYEACIDPGSTITTKPGNNVGRRRRDSIRDSASTRAAA